MVWLSFGAQQVGNVTLDVHTMLLGALATVVGYQTLWLWAFAKIHGWTSGLLPEDTFSQRIFRHVYLERGLLTGLGAIVAGLAVNGRLVYLWANQGFGDLQVSHTMRWALWGFLLLVLGVQTVYGSFFLSMLGMAADKKANRG
jgi:hypothetical protein